MRVSRGGLTTKIHALVDGPGPFLKLLLSAGNVCDIKMAPALVQDLIAIQCGTLLADKGYDSDALRVLLLEDAKGNVHLLSVLLMASIEQEALSAAA